MSMNDPIHNDGDSVLATQTGGDVNRTSNPGEAQTEKTEAPRSSTNDLPLVEIKAPGEQAAKLSPTVSYGTDRYRLARPFTTRL